MSACSLPTPRPGVVERAQSDLFKAYDLMIAFAEAVKKQRDFGIGQQHSLLCNAPTDRGFGSGRCNCGVADILSCLKAYESRDNWEETT